MIQLFNVTVHARDPRQLARFWSAALGYPIVAESDDLVRLRGPATPGAPDLLFLRAGELAPSGGRFHVDLAAADVAAEVERLVTLGATLVDGMTDAGPRPRQAEGIEWIVLADPEGNELCLGSLPAS